MPKSEMPQKLQEVDDQHSSPSFWARYQFEMHGIEAIERDYGFITYKLDGDIGHIVDVYVPEEKRQGSPRRKLFDEVAELLRSRGVTKVVGNVQVSVKGSTRRLSFWLMIGAEVYQANGGLVYFVKSL